MQLATHSRSTPTKATHPENDLDQDEAEVQRDLEAIQLAQKKYAYSKRQLEKAMPTFSVHILEQVSGHSKKKLCHALAYLPRLLLHGQERQP